MARHSTPSLWLPGFDPDSPDLPDPSPEIDLFSAPPSVEAVQVSSSCAIAELEPPPAATPRASWRIIDGKKPDTPHSPWPALGREQLLGLNGTVTKFEANVAAIQALQSLEAGQQPATADQRHQLVRFTGWGGLPAAFNLEGTDPSWRARAGELQALLPDDDYESARASVNNSHYTEVHVIEAMWRAVERFGFAGGRVLEPAAGVGHFLGAMPARSPSAARSPPSRSTGSPAGCCRRCMRRMAPTCTSLRSRRWPCPRTGSTW
ncbi:class I SAM-dependent methyltransferase [Diaphorobacter aerolatus]|uniref:hypothetical protein n=1 Tax=Diaphorobacter aerolatus TaxID=1288495 RepID=UPI001D01F02D|nr:hypothetical protein [Diaphorobacter aerolatus]